MRFSCVGLVVEEAHSPVGISCRVVVPDHVPVAREQGSATRFDERLAFVFAEVFSRGALALCDVAPIPLNPDGELHAAVAFQPLFSNFMPTRSGFVVRFGVMVVSTSSE